MKQEYKDWVDEHYPEYTSSFCKCATATLEMQKTFPELMRVRGEFIDPYLGPREHWWLKTQEGEIIDPTIKQFIYLSDSQYEERDESLPEPKGKCMNCGKYSYYDSNFCSDACHEEYMTDF